MAEDAQAQPTPPASAVEQHAADGTHTANDVDQAAVQAAAEAEQVQHAQPVWNPETGQYYYPGDQSYNTIDYTNINGVMPLPAEHYVVPDGEYGVAAATLSNWAEANVGDGTNGLPLVAPPVNGGDPNLSVHVTPATGELPTPQPPQEKAKKLVLACHFCRGRKLKCDGGRPTCSHCAKRNLECTYDDNVRRRGPGKRTKEMRERAAREAEAAGLGLSAESIAQFASEAGPSTLTEAIIEPTPKKGGRKRKSEAIDEAEKKIRLEEEQQAAAHAAVAAAAAAQQGLGHDLHDVGQSLEGLAHDGMIDPALTGEDGNVMGQGEVLDLPPLEPGTLGQVIQQLNGGQ